MRTSYRIARWWYFRVSDPSADLVASVVRALGPNAGVTQNMASRYLGGIYTGRAVFIYDYDTPHRGITPGELGLSCDGIEDCRRVLCEAVFEKVSSVMDRQGIVVDELVKDLESNLKSISRKFRHLIIHEITHAYIARETSASAYIEGISWRVRFDNMYVLEKIYRAVGRDLAREVGSRGFKVHEEFRIIEGFKGLGEGDAERILKNLEGGLDRLSKDELFRAAIGDGFRHQIWLRIFAGGIVIPVLEVATWYILGSNLNKTLKEYEDEGVFDKNFHSPIALEMIKAIEEKRPGKTEVAKAARAVLDLPPTTYEDLKRELRASYDKRKIAEHFQKVVRDKFKEALEGRSSGEVSSRHKTLLSIMLYAVPVDKIPDMVSMFVEILNSEPEVRDRLLEILGRSGGRMTGTYTSFFIKISVKGRTETVVYDPLSSLTCRPEEVRGSIIGVSVRRTGVGFTTFENLVGDLPLALRGFLPALYLFREYESEKSWAEYVARHTGLGGKEIGVLVEIVERMRGISLDELLGEPSDKVVREAIELFLYAVLRLGEGIKGFGGLHALWFL